MAVNPALNVTESASLYQDIESMSTLEIVTGINQEDQKVAEAINEVLPDITKIVDAIIPKFSNGGRLFYIGAGTSGRLGILDASEIPPTYGLPPDRVIGLIAGGDAAIRKSVEFAEDDVDQAQIDLKAHDLNENDSLIGIAASGSTPYVIGALKYAKEIGVFTASVSNNANSPISKNADVYVEVIVGPEFITGSTRMKSGTSQKLILNMISTTLMAKIGRVKGNKMVNMQLNNEKLVNRGVNFIMDELKIGSDEALELLKKHGSVSEALLRSQHLSDK